MQAKQKVLLENLGADKEKEEDNDTESDATLLPPLDSYDEVHEGKVVSWDESFEEKKESTSWDEEIKDDGEGIGSCKVF